MGEVVQKQIRKCVGRITSKANDCGKFASMLQWGLWVDDVKNKRLNRQSLSQC